MVRFFFLFCLLSSHVFAGDLNDGDRARFNYESVPVYKIISARPTLQSEGSGFYSGNLRIGALVEGNICLNNENSLGTYEIVRGDRTYLDFLVRHLKTNDNVMCAEYSKETRISGNIKVLIESDETKVYDLNGNTVTLQRKNGEWKVTIANRENIK